MNARSWVGPVIALMSLATLAGCSGKGPGDYAHVSGTVTLDGSPIEGAKLTFVSTTEVKGQKAEYSTVTDSSGKYMIAGVGKDPGMPPGMYKVAITKLVMKGGKFKAPEEGFDMTQLEMSGMGINELPKQYADANSTNLTATLESGKNQNVNFDLKGK
ncbi:MAG: carboxypeptidase regulatory-like domain-containing protein [Zavarzinella sp.]|nr:carboxypeptidase regulatory-like domain-containing protein [Zavarzinella sp.]